MKSSSAGHPSACTAGRSRLPYAHRPTWSLANNEHRDVIVLLAFATEYGSGDGQIEASPPGMRAVLIGTGAHAQSSITSVMALLP